MRGEFIRGDGQVIPNNISLEGAKLILGSAFRDSGLNLYMCLVSGAPSIDMTQGDMLEPVLGTNGYARQLIEKGEDDWLVVGNLGDEAYIESKMVTFEATGGDFSRGIQRMALVTTSALSALSPVVSLSSPLTTELVITPTTDLVDRQFKYRIYL